MIFCFPCLEEAELATVGQAYGLRASLWSTLDWPLEPGFETSFYRLLVMLGYCWYLLWEELTWEGRLGVLPELLFPLLLEASASMRFW